MNGIKIIESWLKEAKFQAEHEADKYQNQNQIKSMIQNKLGSFLYTTVRYWGSRHRVHSAFYLYFSQKMPVQVPILFGDF